MKTFKIWDARDGSEKYMEYDSHADAQSAADQLNMFIHRNSSLAAIFRGLGRTSEVRGPFFVREK
jgi:hypothetical protein